MKNEQYQNLVEKRKKHTFPDGLSNPAIIENGIYDCEHIGAWSQWQGDLEAKILVIGQDWGDVAYFNAHKGKDDDKNTTNQNLQKLFLELGFDIGLPNSPIPNPIFFTNAILGIKGSSDTKQMSSSVKDSWIRNSNEHFTHELIDIIKPQFIITLGAKPLDAMRFMYKEIPNKKLSDLIENDNHIRLNNGIQLFAFNHCGGLGLANRSFENQLADWQKAKAIINP